MGRIVGENKHKGTLYPVDSKAIYRIIYEVVAVLPTENIKTSVIYCVPIIGKDNEYDMFLYINGWSKIGSGSIDLSDYYTKEEVDGIVADISTLSFKIVQEKPIEDIETNIIYLIPKSGSSAGNIYEEWIYIDNKWELLGTTDIDLSSYMTLAPLNPTAQEIEAMSSGQLYGDTVNHKGVVKDGQEFYDTEYINSHYYDKNRMRLIYNGMTVSSNIPPTTAPRDVYSLNHLWLCYPDNTLFRLTDISYDSSTTVFLTWQRANNRIVTSTSTAPERTENNVDYKYCAGDIWVQYDSVTNKFLNLFVCVGNQSHGVDYKTWYFSYTWVDMFQNTYTKTEIDSMIGDIETALSEV